MSERKKRPTVLIIDDDPNVALGLRNILEEEYEVRVATSAAVGVRMQKEHRSDAIILDMLMPKMGGYDTALAIREIDPSAPIIVFTGYAASYPMEEVVCRIDPIGYLVKGDRDVDNELLLTTVRTAIRYRQALLSLENQEKQRQLLQSGTGTASVVRRGKNGTLAKIPRNMLKRICFVLEEAELALGRQAICDGVEDTIAALKAGNRPPKDSRTISDYMLMLLQTTSVSSKRQTDLRSLLVDMHVRGQIAYEECDDKSRSEERVECLVDGYQLGQVLIYLFTMAAAAHPDQPNQLRANLTCFEKNDPPQAIIDILPATEKPVTSSSAEHTVTIPIDSAWLAAKVLVASFGGTLKKLSDPTTGIRIRVTLPLIKLSN